jgi:hypothetical protein
MDPHISVVTALLNSVAYNCDDDAVLVPETDFVPFNFSHLRNFTAEAEQAKNPVGGGSQYASDALPA